MQLEVQQKAFHCDLFRKYKAFELRRLGSFEDSIKIVYGESPRYMVAVGNDSAQQSTMIVIVASAHNSMQWVIMVYGGALC